MTVREMKMIPDKVGVVCLALLGLRISVEVCDGHGVGVKIPKRNVLLFQRKENGQYALETTQGYYLRCYCGESSQQLSPRFSFNV